ncbi:MAG: PotD/PotF family extracellular solute-binding protein [Gammaproteobacteria bacterium]|nr:PotD/PotF family extracellular solute-binding protein [Gammaproteobacteria bacterium]
MRDYGNLQRLARRNPLPGRHRLQTATSRRRFVAGLGAAAGFALFGCGPSRETGRELALLTWDAYADPRLLDLWRKSTGGSIRYEIHTSDPTSVNRLRAGETAVWDFVNLNNPWARKELWPAGLIRALPRNRFEPLYDAMFDKFAPPYHWAMSDDGEHLLGVVQRFETFDFVVNADVISPHTAKDEGWDLFNNPDFGNRYGILAYEDWNVMDICMGAGIDPFREKAEDDYTAFEATARRWIDNARMITTDFAQLNLGIINGEIDAYFTGGTYSITSARLEGMNNLYAITPYRGPARGKGGINWIELNSAVANPAANDDVLDFLEWITQPEPAYIVANGNGNLQPVSQMAQPDVLARFTSEQLAALQWDEFEERIGNSVEFDIVPGYDRLYDIYSAAMRARG